MAIKRAWARLNIAIVMIMASLSAAFAEAVGGPQPWEMGLQPGFSPTKDRIIAFHDGVLYVITGIVVFVTALLVIVAYRFRASRHPTPNKVSHNTAIEIVWTVVPAIILVTMAFPSLRLLHFLDRAQNADMTVKVIGHQWYWAYEYPDYKSLAFDSYMIDDSELKDGQPRLLTVDNQLVVPAGATVRVLVTSGDVLHSWMVPPLGVQIYAVPGRSNETWFKISEPGVYYGQCNQICGVNHGFMPISIRALDKAAFATWMDDAQKKLADAAPAAMNVAAAR